MRKSKPIRAELEEWRCKKCWLGVLRATDDHPELRDYLTQMPESIYHVRWPHACSHCGYVYDWSDSCPVILYGGQRWVLEKAVNKKLFALLEHLKRSKDLENMPGGNLW
ncbi:hypothetical protein EUZ85_14360 [Hahella sp. KA22]|uniref:hypothetical protein n=1 Tax=Hahella sp. KA22 TaxID=1628392 RepID=UPI000FDF162C|nr:hypothetical protein [Hahella sp. KA22]AZZ91848.1 hypothetical protein ENC22_11795 [Hahella sp. KA22]QAY55219.1 hypothetical protein EUZ85_14360 [Hahella sp. KA22]